MREILFRGKSEDNGEWIYGVLQYVWCSNYPHIYSKKDRKIIEVIPETVGQFTGLTDKNGVKIFEGDILKSCTHHGTWIYTVDWCSDCAMFVLPCITNEKLETDFSNCSGEDFEIIGNIFDNSELLTESKNTQKNRPEWHETMLKKWTETR